jgi:hypothetical protein
VRTQPQCLKGVGKALVLPRMEGHGFTGCGKKAPSVSLALTTEDGWPISRWFFARCGNPLLFPSNSRFARWHLAVNIGGIPHLAKNQRDMGHPSSVANARESNGAKQAAARQAVPFKEFVFPQPLKLSVRGYSEVVAASVRRRPSTPLCRQNVVLIHPLKVQLDWCFRRGATNQSVTQCR